MMADWMDWSSVDKFCKMGLKHFMSSERWLLSIIAVTFLVVAMDAQLGTISHWIPEFACFYLFGAFLYKFGFRKAAYPVVLISIVWIMGFGIFAHGELYAIILTTAFSLIYLVGYLRARPSEKREG